jgi:hypothetical protein
MLVGHEFYPPGQGAVAQANFDFAGATDFGKALTEKLRRAFGFCAAAENNARMAAARVKHPPAFNGFNFYLVHHPRYAFVSGV